VPAVSPLPGQVLRHRRLARRFSSSPVASSSKPFSHWSIGSEPADAALDIGTGTDTGIDTDTGTGVDDGFALRPALVLTELRRIGNGSPEDLAVDRAGPPQWP
jgi:hypothetical protein